MDININVDYGNKYYIACSNDKGFKIIGYYTLEIAQVMFEENKQF